MRGPVIGIVIGLSVSAAASGACASTTSGLAIDTFLHSAMTSFAGPVAYAAVLVGIVVAGARLMSGGDLYGFLRTLIMLTVIAGLTLGGQTVICMMSANAATVGAPPASNAISASTPRSERLTR